MMYNITLTQKEMDMLINATNIMHLRYKRPEMTESTRKAADSYGELCSRLYYEQLRQLDEVIPQEAQEE